MIPRGRLDIGWRDLLFGAFRCFVPGGRAALAQDIEEFWSPEGGAVATLSVRSGFDLILSVLRFPPGTEVLMSAVTIADMATIAEAHGLVPIPVDLDMDLCSVDPDALDAAAGPAARVLVVAHLFGSRMPLAPLARFARERGLLILEDCAQGYVGNGYRGHPEADVSLFSFGPIKTNTALGGALLRFRDPCLAERVRNAQAALPPHSRGRYLARVLKYLWLKSLLFRPCYGAFARFCRIVGRSHDQVIARAVRGFAGGDLLTGIRHRPSAPLLALLRRRLRTFRQRRITQRAEDALRVLETVPNVGRLGGAAKVHTHWLVAIRVAEPEAAVARLWAHGVDGTRGASSLRVLSAPPHRPEAEPERARQAMSGVVYLPSYPGMPRSALSGIRSALGAAEAKPRTLELGVAP